jgi:hypothetical protein
MVVGEAFSGRHQPGPSGPPSSALSGPHTGASLALGPCLRVYASQQCPHATCCAAALLARALGASTSVNQSTVSTCNICAAALLARALGASNATCCAAALLARALGASTSTEQERASTSVNRTLILQNLEISKKVHDTLCGIGVASGRASSLACSPCVAAPLLSMYNCAVAQPVLPLLLRFSPSLTTNSK